MRATFLVLCACGRINFDPGGVIADGAAEDSGDMPVVCTGPFGAPMPIAELNTPAFDEWGPTISDDGLELFFGTNADGSYDIYVATRVSRTAPFGAPTRLDTINTINDDDNPFLSADGRRMWFDSLGTLYTTSRAARGEPWQQRSPLVELDAAELDVSPALDRDELTLYFTSTRPGGQGGYDMWVATRANVTAPFSPPALLPLVNTSMFDCCGHLAADQTKLLYQTTSLGGGQKLVAVDLGPTGLPIGAPSLFTQAMIPGEQIDIAFTRDDSLAVFASRPIPNSGTFDLYMIERSCP